LSGWGEGAQTRIIEEPVLRAERAKRFFAVVNERHALADFRMPGITGYPQGVIAGEDALAAARKLLRERFGTDFNRPIVYPKLGIA
jgi:hypothetical protein